MKSGNNKAFEQSHNTQVAVDQATLLIVANTLSNHANDKQEALPMVDAIPVALGMPKAALDADFFSEENVRGLLDRGIEPYIATGREPHHRPWHSLFQPLEPPAPDTPLALHMAYKLQTALGQLIYGARKYTVEPVIGIIKEVLGFRQFSLHSQTKADGEWNLVCLAFNFKRLHLLRTA